MAEPTTGRREDYPHFLAITTRWMDNGLYGHINNVVYYSFFDTIINEYLIRAGGLDIHNGRSIGLAIETLCRFHRPLAYPEAVDAGLRVGKLGNSSMRYEVGLFRAGDAEPAATGYFVHVFVDRATRRPQRIPAPIRAALARPRAIKMTRPLRARKKGGATRRPRSFRWMPPYAAF
ncbi:MAG TPA: thioesterase family protein [Stellaceae bacterium]|nr:thioesterase family protein [Stellaceae bacterium]